VHVCIRKYMHVCARKCVRVSERGARREGRGGGMPPQPAAPTARRPLKNGMYLPAGTDGPAAGTDGRQGRQAQRQHMRGGGGRPPSGCAFADCAPKP